MDDLKTLAQLEAARTPKPPPIWLLGFLTFSGTLAMHMLLPALPDLARDLHTSAAGAQQTLSIYILGLAMGQLFYGPLSDRIGRKPTLICGLALYAVAGAVATIAPAIELMLVARLFQALGGCAALVLVRAIIRETGTAGDSMRRMALVLLAMLLAPGVAPVCGALLASTFGWRSILAATTLLGFVLLVLTIALLRETAMQQAGSLRALAREYRSLLASKAFMALVIGGSCCTTAVYAFISVAPFIYTADFHRSIAEAGFYVTLVTIGTALGTIAVGQLARRVRSDRLILFGSLYGVAVTAIFLAIVAAGRATLLSTLVLSTLFGATAGIMSPVVTMKAISINPRALGSASGLYGFFQMMLGALCTLLSSMGSDPFLMSALVLAGASLIGLLAFMVERRC